jgi:hypothetical protein
MRISYEEAVLAHKELEIKILADPNVVSIGVVAETNELGEQTGDYAVQVGVISIEAYARAQKCGQSSIPTEFLLHSKGSPTEEKHIHINVVREGEIEALTEDSENDKTDIPSAKDNIPVNSMSAVSYTLRRRLCPTSGATCRFGTDHASRILQKKSFSTAPAPVSTWKRITFAQNIRTPPAKYRMALIAAGVGCYAVARKLTKPSQSSSQTKGLLSRALTSCGFFRAESKQSNIGTFLRSDVEFRR